MMSPSSTGWTERPGVIYPNGMTAECTYCHRRSDDNMTDAALPQGWIGVTELPTPRGWVSACRSPRCCGQHYLAPRKVHLFCSTRCIRLWMQAAEKEA